MNKVITSIFLVLSLIVCSQENAVEKQNNLTKEKDTTIIRLEKELEEVKIDTLKADILFSIGSHLFGKDNPRAKKLLNDAAELLPNASSNNKLRGKIYQYLAAINNDQGNYPIAMRQFIKAKEQFDITNDSLRIANLHYNMAILHNFQGDFELAKENLYKAIHINTIYKDTLSLAHNYSTLGEDYGMTNKPDSALFYFNKSKVLFTILKDQRGLNNLKAHLAKFHLGQGDYKKSIDLFKECVDFGVENEIPVYQVIYSNKLAWAYKEAKDYKNALKYSKQSLDIALRDNHKQWILNGYLQKSEIEEALGNYKDAYASAKFYKIYADSIFNKKNIRKIKELELTYEFKKEKVRDSVVFAKEKELAKVEIENLATKNKVKNQWLLFGGLGLLLLFLVAYLLRSKKFAVQQQELQQQFSQDLIKGQEDERTRLARELHDSVGQKLMLLTKKTKTTGDDAMEDLASSSLEEIRSISRGLYPSNLERLGLTTAIKAMLHEMDSNTELFFVDEIENIDDLLPKDSELHVFRIIQETLNNIIKHSEAKSVKINIQKTSKTVEVFISDNGKGFDLNSKRSSLSLGMKTLFERAKIINTNMNLESNLGKGTTITLSIPV